MSIALSLLKKNSVKSISWSSRFHGSLLFVKQLGLTEKASKYSNSKFPLLTNPAMDTQIFYHVQQKKQMCSKNPPVTLSLANIPRSCALLQNGEKRHPAAGLR